VKLQQDKDDFTYGTISQLAYNHACIFSKQLELKKVLQLTKVSFFSTLAHQATKTQAHGLFLERETQLFLSVKLQDISFYKHKHVGCLKRAKKEENVLQNILHLLKFTFWASLLSKPQRTALVASKKCHTTVF